MDALSKLISQKVIAKIEVDENEFEYIEGIVTSVDVNDFYFYEKNEPIYITVSISPTSYSHEYDPETFSEIPLSNITKA